MNEDIQGHRMWNYSWLFHSSGSSGFMPCTHPSATQPGVENKTTKKTDNY